MYPRNISIQNILNYLKFDKNGIIFFIKEIKINFHFTLL
jgi:hypothetical protein